MPIKKCCLLCGAVLFGASLPLYAASPSADTNTHGTVLSVPAQPQAQHAPVAHLPHNLMTKKEVLAQYGQPAVTYPSVGNPPISRWDYPQFSVFFEYNLVLNSVVPGQFPPIDHRNQLLSSRQAERE